MSDVKDTTVTDNMVGDTYKKRITTDMVIGKIKQDMIPETGQTAWLMTVYGDIEDYEVGVTSFGEFLRLTGTMIADNELTGEVFNSNTAVLPRLAEMVIKNHLKAVGFGQPNGPKVVSFAMQIGIDRAKDDEIDTGKVDDAGNPVIIKRKKHTWVVRPVGRQVKTTLMSFRDQMRAAIKGLPAPVITQPVLETFIEAEGQAGLNLDAPEVETPAATETEKPASGKSRK